MYNKYSFARASLIGTGITLSVIGNVARGAASYLYNQIAITLSDIAVANWIVGAVIGISASAAIWAMGT